ncbi:24221_t:CDS:2, partial [Dentiscutata erythropus]
ESNGFIIEINKVKTISQLRDIIKNDKKKNTFANIDANELTLFKVNISESRKCDIHPGIDIKRDFGGVELVNDFDSVEEHFGVNPAEKHIHIIIKPPTNIARSFQQGYTQVTPLEPDIIFKDFLNSEHGQFLKHYIEKNDQLPSYNSKIPLKTAVPVTYSGDRPSLLLYNLPGAACKGNGGSSDIEAIENYLLNKMTDNFEENRNKAIHI